MAASCNRSVRRLCLVHQELMPHLRCSDFARKYYLNRHQRVHTGLRPFIKEWQHPVACTRCVFSARRTLAASSSRETCCVLCRPFRWTSSFASGR
ncbi:Protein of unknown function [Gryllus bimaculatus]|nr:Protein of unknown function [Gryllus bimaculatus]